MLDVESLIIYSSVLIISCFWGFFYDKYESKLGLFYAFFFVAFFCAIRYDVGFDYRGYVEIFNNIRDGKESYVEPGFYALNLLFAHVPNGYFYVLGIMSFATVGLLFLVFKRMQNVRWNIYFLFTFQFIFQLNSQVRQGFTIVLFFWALLYLEEQKYWKYILIILFGTLFHYTIAFFLILIPVRKLQLASYTWIILMISSFALSLTGIFEKLGNIILTNLPFYAKYLTNGDRVEAEAHTNILIVFFWVCVGILIALGSKSIRNKKMLNFYLLSITLYPIFVPYHLIERMLLYFMFQNGLLAAEICKKDQVMRKILFLIALFVFTVYCLNNWGLAGGYPYYTIFGDHLISDF